MMKITMNLMNSPKFHKTESGAIMIELLMTRWVTNAVDKFLRLILEGRLPLKS